MDINNQLWTYKINHGHTVINHEHKSSIMFINPAIITKNGRVINLRHKITSMGIKSWIMDIINHSLENHQSWT